MAPRKTSKSIEEEVNTPVEEEAVPEIPHYSEIFNMRFSTDIEGELIGVRRGMRPGTIEFYPIKE